MESRTRKKARGVYKKQTKVFSKKKKKGIQKRWEIFSLDYV